MPSRSTVYTYLLNWRDGGNVTVKVLAEGDKGSVLSIEGDGDRVSAIKVYTGLPAIEAELNFIAAKDRATLRRISLD
jgi:hypothetical protein